MDKIDLLRKHGLFDAKVPRYTSYPPANYFQNGIGARFQKDWLHTVRDGDAVSIYVHVPFCKRLCWFCACRTQGTKTLRPVEAYVAFLRQEIETVCAHLPRGVRMSRLHFGGGTPTILSPQLANALLTTIFAHIEKTADFEFSVEIDPTEAPPELLNTLIEFGLNRASLGVQDFAPDVQEAIGRPQSLVQTQWVIDYLRGAGISSLNLDLLYGLPRQTEAGFAQTLRHVLEMQPDRLAIYGYAHVPWMSKRQIMIQGADLPDMEKRFRLFEMAQNTILGAGYQAIGIDHFAVIADNLAIAARTNTLRRNFQGYTDDQSETLIGFGASSISRFRDGFSQNAPATSAYQGRIGQSGMAGHKGYRMTVSDVLRARIIMDLMCYFEFRTGKLCQSFPGQSQFLESTGLLLQKQYPDLFLKTAGCLRMHDFAKPLVRVVAAFIDDFVGQEGRHSVAI